MGRILIRNGRVPVGDTVVEANVVIDGEYIEAVTKKEPGGIDEVYDARGGLVIPGGIDIHAHIYDPDYTSHEDWRTGSLSAVFGGITSVYDMPLRLYVDNVEKLKMKIEAGLRDSYVNFGVHAGMMNRENMHSIPELAEHGVVGFKVFTVKPFRADSHAITGIMRLVRENNGVVMIHAEDDALIDEGLERVKGRNDPRAHHEARTGEAEAAAVLRMGLYGLQLSTHTHIVHLSSRLGAESMRWLKSIGAPVTAETCPQYLFFTLEDVDKYGNYLKITPSLKTRHDVEALWRALADGTVDAVASDHAPAPREEKEVDVWKAWGGIPVIELIIPLLYTYGVLEKRITLHRFIEVVSTNPARIMHQYPLRGTLAPGSAADIAILDTSTKTKVTADMLHHKVDWTPFEGFTVTGLPRHVFVNGQPVVIDRELVAEKPAGKYLRPLK